LLGNPYFSSATQCGTVIDMNQEITTSRSPSAQSDANPGDIKHRWLVLALLCTAQLLVILDATIVNIALPSIQRDLHFSDTNLQWVINAYVLTFGGLLLLGGRAADMFIRRNVFLAGLVVFVAASLACGLSSSEATLIAGRAVQGVGAALMSAAALSILVVTFTAAKERNIALGVWGATSGVAGALGVILGGALTDGPGWEWVFFINVPIGLAAGAASLRYVSTHRAADRPPLDPLGALTATAGIGLLIFAIVRTEQEGWGSTATLGCLAGAAALLAAFLAIEARHRAPLVPLGVFRLRNLSGGNAVSLTLGGVMFATFFFVTLYMQQVLGYSPIKTGVAYLPLALSVIIASGVASNLIARLGFKPLLAAGMILLAAGLVWFAQIDPGGDYVSDVLGPSLLWGPGLGIAIVVVIAAATDDLGGEGESGLASGLVNTTLQVGGAIGLAALSTLAFDRVDRAMADAHGDHAALPGALTEGFEFGLYLGAGLAALGALIALLAISGRDDQRTRTSDVALDARPAHQGAVGSGG
jgi:EmrB/QacA subfamily drug resistance transporter